jgi:hypothetical protein
MSEEFIYTLVNEVGEKYDTFHDPLKALLMLEQFPNDFMIVTTKGGADVDHIIAAIVR